jgi:hypothetical protein
VGVETQEHDAEEEHSAFRHCPLRQESEFIQSVSSVHVALQTPGAGVFVGFGVVVGRGVDVGQTHVSESEQLGTRHNPLIQLKPLPQLVPPVVHAVLHVNGTGVGVLVGRGVLVGVGVGVAQTQSLLPVQLGFLHALVLVEDAW